MGTGGMGWGGLDIRESRSLLWEAEALNGIVPDRVGLLYVMCFPAAAKHGDLKTL